MDVENLKSQKNYLIKISKTAYLENKSIANILIIFLLFGVLLWLTNSKTEDFGLNFFTEMLGVVVTVFIVDQIVKKREEEKALPQKLAVYEDIRLMVSKYLSFWLSTYSCSVPEQAPEKIDNFFSNEGMGKIWNYLYLNSKPNVTPETTWWLHLPHQMKEIQNMGNKILDRHSGSIDSEIYSDIHQITESTFLSTFQYLQSIRQSDRENKSPRINLLCNYTMKPQEADYNAIIKLYEWCVKNYEILSKYSNILKKVSDYTPPSTGENIPRCMILPEILNREIEALNKYKEKTG